MPPTPVSSSADRASAVRGCLEACRRCRVVVETILEQGAESADRAYRAIGPHMRHCVDHFVCLLRGVESGTVDYDARDRGEHLERDPRQLLERLDWIDERLRSLDAEAPRLEVRQEAEADGAPVTVESNLERELVFLSGHTIHHIAIMGLVAEAAGVSIPQGLDVAFSTASARART